MRSIIVLLFVCLAFPAWAGAPINSLTNNAGVTIEIPANGLTATRTAKNFFFWPTPSVVMEYPFVFQLSTNQSFVVQDELGHNIFGIRADAYNVNQGRRWEFNYGSKTQPLIDHIFDMGAGADVTWRINGDLNNALLIQTYGAGIGIQFAYANTNYYPDFQQVPLFDNYGTIYATALVGQPIHLTQAAVVGAAAGTGGSVGVTIDGNATDLSVQITLVTGNAGTTAGTAVTYTTANDVAQFNAIEQPTTKPFKPVGSPANDAASAEFTKVKFTGTTGNIKVEVRATQALTVNTTYIWNVFLVR